MTGCSEYMHPHLNIHNSSTRSHPSEEENRSKNCKCKGPYRPDAIRRNAKRIFSFQKQIKPSTDKNFTSYADQIAKIA